MQPLFVSKTIDVPTRHFISDKIKKMVAISRKKV